MKYDLSRSITIDVNIEKVRPLIEDFNHWAAWSPWSIIHPEHNSKIEGGAGQEGHTMKWDSDIIGSGQMMIEKKEGDSIDYDLQFFKPFKSKAKSIFIMEVLSDNQTKVTWTMASSMPVFLFFMVKTMKSWIEMDYDRGLKMLKELAEKGSINAKTTNDGIVDFDGFSYVGVQTTSSMEDMPNNMKTDFGKLMELLEKTGARAEKWVSIYTKINMANKAFTYVAAASDEGLQGKDLGEGYLKGNIPSGKMLRITHKGSYNFLGNAWSMGMMHARAKKLKMRGKPFEFYVNSPKDTKEEDLVTYIYFPVKI